MQQAQRGKRPSRSNFNSRYGNSSFVAPPRHNRYQRSQTLPHSNHIEYDSIYQRAPPGFRPNTNYPPTHPQSNSTYAYNTPQPYPNTQSYNYQSKPAQKYIPIGGNIPPSELLSPNKNSHKLNDTKGAIYDLLFQKSEGILGAHLEEEYFKVYRDKLPYHKLGYDNSKQFIESIPDVVKIDRVNGREMCFLARRPEESSPVNNEKSIDWLETTQITLESFFPLKKSESAKSPDIKSADEIETIDLTQVTLEPDADRNHEIVLTEDEIKRHLNDLKSKVYIFLLGKGSNVPIDEFEYQYRVINREDPEIAYRLLGYSTLEEFLHNILDVVVLIRDSNDGLSVGVKTRSTSPPSIVPPRIIPQPVISRMPPNIMRPYPPPQYPMLRGPIPNSGFVPPGAPMHHMRPHRMPPPPNHSMRFPHHPPGLPLLQFMPPIAPLLPEPPRPTNSHNPPGFDPALPPQLPLSNVDLFSPLASDFSSLFMNSNQPTKPFGITTTTINSLSMDFNKAQKEFVETQIRSVATGRGEVNPRLASEPVLRYLEGTNVVLLAGEDFGKCACIAVALTHGLNVLTDSMQSLVICNDMTGMQKMFECLETVTFNTGLKVASYESVEKLFTSKQDSHIVVIIYTMMEQYMNKCDISQLTRIGIYNLTTDPTSYNEFIFNLKRSRCLLDQIKFFFATNPHNEAGSYILKLVNTVMTSRCSFAYYGKDQANHLTLIPHDTESLQIHTESQMLLRPRLLASVTSNLTDFPNHFDRYLLPLKASCSNFTILSNHMEEALLQQSLALIALMKVEPTSHLTQVVILVPNEQQAKDFQELCGAMGNLEEIKTSMVNSKTSKEDIRYSHICIGW